ADEDVVPGDAEVRFDEIGVLLDGQGIGGERVLGRRAGRAAVGYELLPGLAIQNGRDGESTQNEKVGANCDHGGDYSRSSPPRRSYGCKLTREAAPQRTRKRAEDTEAPQLAVLLRLASVPSVVTLQSAHCGPS